MLARLCTLVLAIGCLSGARAPDEPSKFRLEREDLIETDQTLVVRLSIAAPAAPVAEQVRLVFRWKDRVSYNIGSGITGNGVEADRRADIVIVAQVADGTKEHPPMLMLSTAQKPSGGGGALSSQAYRLPFDAKVGDVVSIDIRPGDYALVEPLPIGVVGGEPMYLYVEPDGVEDGG